MLHFKMSLQIGRCCVFFDIKKGCYSLWKLSANETACRFTWYYFSFFLFIILWWHLFGLFCQTNDSWCNNDSIKFSVLFKMLISCYNLQVGCGGFCMLICRLVNTSILSLIFTMINYHSLIGLLLNQSRLAGSQFHEVASVWFWFHFIVCQCCRLVANLEMHCFLYSALL